MSKFSLDRSWLYFILGFVFLSCLLAWSLFCVPYLPTNDGPQHILSAYIENHYDDPGSIYPSYLTRMPQFAYRGFAVIMKPMERLFGWQLGAQFAILIILLLNAWGFSAMVLAFNPKRKWLAYLGFPLAWSWNLYMGFFSFMVGTGLGYWIIAFVLSRKYWNWMRWATLSFLLLIQAMCHVFTAALTGIFVLCLFVSQQRTWQEKLKHALIIGLVGIPAGFIALGTLQSWSTLKSDFEATHVFRESFGNLIYILPRTIMPGVWANTLPWIALILFSLTLGIGRLEKNKLNQEEKIFLGIGIVTLLMVIFAPRDIEKWQLFSQRFIPIAVSSLLILIPIETIKIKRAQMLIGFLFLMASSSSVATFAYLNQELAEGCSDLIAAFKIPMRPKGQTYFVPLNLRCGVASTNKASKLPYVSPEFQAIALYAVATDSLPSHLFLGNSAGYAFDSITNPHIERTPPYKGFEPRTVPPDEAQFLLGNSEDKQRVLVRSQAIYLIATRGLGAHYEGIFTTGLEEQDEALFKQLGFVEDWRQGSVGLAHFVPCTVRIESKKYSGAQAPEINLGIDVYPADIFIVAQGILKERKPGGVTVYEYPYAPCGDVWVRAGVHSTAKLFIEDPAHRGLHNSVRYLLEKLK